MKFEVVYSPRAQRQLNSIYDFIAERAGPTVARRYTKQIAKACAAHCDAPLRRTPRNDIRPGLRMTTRKRRVVIFYSVERDRVVILGIFYAGQNYLTALQKQDRD